MRTAGTLWNEFLAQLPKDSYTDDSDETINGLPPTDKPIAGTDVVEITTGRLHDGVGDYLGKDLLTEYRLWLKARTTQLMLVEVPRDRMDAFVAGLEATGSRVVQP
jgi:hypothetical protein